MNKSARNLIIGIAIAILTAIVVTLTPGSRKIITLDNTVHDCGGESIRGATILANHVTLRNCVMDGWVGTGIWVSGNDNLIENNVVLDGGTISKGSAADKDGIRFFGSGHKFVNNKVTINTCAAPAHCDAVQTYGTDAGHHTDFIGNEFHNFTIYQAGTNYLKGQCFQMEYGAHDITLRNNILHCYRGVNLGDERYPATDRINIVNNTFVGQIPPLIPTVLEWGVFVGKGTNTIVQNNIFYNMEGEHLFGPMTAGYNLVYRNDGGRLYEPRYISDLWGVNPLFVDPANGDYRLSFNSPARGQANDGGDPGAFQFDESATP